MRYLFCAHKCLDSYMNIIVPFFISFGGSFVCWFNMCLNWFCESFIIKMKFQCQTAARTIWIRGKFWAVFVCERFVDQSLYFFFWKLHFLQCDIFTQFKTFIVMFKWFFFSLIYEINSTVQKNCDDIHVLVDVTEKLS